MRGAFALGVTLAVGGCAGYHPPLSTASDRGPTAIRAAFGKTWEAARARQDCGSRYCFALTVIQSLGEAHKAYLLWPDSALDGCAPGADPQALVTVLYNAKQHMAQFQSAQDLLNPYRASRDSVIRNTITFLDGAYLIHGRRAQKIAAYCRLLADGKTLPGFGTRSQMADSAANDKAQLDLALEGVLAATGELGDGLSAMDPRTDRLTFLLLTAKQREELLSALRREFGPEVVRGKPLSTDFGDAAESFYGWLNDPQWKLKPASN
jgi:hypothetical protein